MLCTCCLEKHDVAVTEVNKKTIFKDKEIEYKAICYYCGNTDEYFEDEEKISRNDVEMKNSSRKISGLLTTQDIVQ